MTTRISTDRWWVVIGMGLAVFMASLDMSVVNLALPAISDTFGAATATTQWVVLGYLLPLVALALPTGRWLDGIDHRGVLVAACAGFATFSVAAALAPGIGWLIAARVLQGVCGSALMTLIPVLISTSVHAGVRGRAMGLVDTLGMLGLISGPAIGGLIVDSLGWPWIFYLNLPVCAALIALAFLQLPRGARACLPERATAVEAAVLTAAAAMVMLALTLAAGRAPMWLFLGFAAVPLMVFWHRQAASAPVRELLAVPPLQGPLAALASTAAATGLVFFIVPFQLITILHVPAPVAGLTMLAFPLGAAVFSPVAGYLADRHGDRRIALIGMVSLICGLLLLMPAGPAWGAADVAWRLAVAGAGLGLFNAPNMSAAMSAAPGDRLATAGGATSVARQGGFACGPALATLVWALSGYGPGGLPSVFAAAAIVVATGGYPLARAVWRDRTATTGSAWRERILGAIWTLRPDSSAESNAAPAPAPARAELVAAQDSHALHAPVWADVPLTEKLYGREGEQRRIMRMLHTVTQESGAVLHIEGGWGSGRTRLLREAAGAALRLGFTVVDGDWDPGAEPALLRDNSPSRQPVLVVLDDLHLADPAFARRLNSLPWRMRDRPIAWLFSRLRGAGGPAVDRLFACAHPSGGRMDLRPLTAQAVRLLMADATYGAFAGPPGLVRAVGGNPLLTVEVARGIHGQGPDGAAGLPPIRVQACVRRGLTELAGCRALLRVGAVLGRRFALADAAALLARPAADLLEPLDEAMAAGILDDDGERLVFTQELFWRCVVLSLPPSARTALRRDATTKRGRLALLQSPAEEVVDLAG